MKIITVLFGSASLAAIGVGFPKDASPTALQESAFHHDGILGTSLDLRFVSPSAAVSDRAETVALAEIERLRLILSSWDSTSEVSQLFSRGALDHPSAELVSVLNAYTKWAEKSGHAYSARVGDLTRLWQQGEASGVVPDPLLLASAVREIAQPAWRIEANAGRITALTSHRVDLNSLGKGFIIDRVIGAIRDSVPGVRGALVNIGGDIQVWGTAPVGNSWHIAVANPQDHADNATPLARLAVHEGAVSTSGDYQRGFTIGGQHYSHIFDPRTGYPVDHVIGVTVIAPTNATANALATTLSVLTPEAGLALVRSVPGAEAMLVTANGTIEKTKGFASYQEPVPAPATHSAPVFTAKVNIDVTPTEKNRHAPFVAVWITDTAGKNVRTLIFWGDKEKYQPELSKWWNANHGDIVLVDAVARATRPAGKYSLDWDGLDQKGVAAPAGPYLFWLEAAFEDGAHSAKSVAVTCGPAKATGSIPSAAAFTGAEISCDPVKP